MIQIKIEELIKEIDDTYKLIGQLHDEINEFPIFRSADAERDRDEKSDQINSLLSKVHECEQQLTYLTG